MEHFSLEIPPLGNVIEQEEPVHHHVEHDPSHPTLFDNLGEYALAQSVTL